jgi:hypothetical protein
VIKDDIDNENDTLKDNFNNMNSKYEPSTVTKDSQMIDDDPNVMKNNNNDEHDTLTNNFNIVDSSDETNTLAIVGSTAVLKFSNDDKYDTMANDFINLNAKDEPNMSTIDGPKVELLSIERFASIENKLTNPNIPTKPNHDQPTHIKLRDSNINTVGELSESERYSNDKDYQRSSDEYEEY